MHLRIQAKKIKCGGFRFRGESGRKVKGLESNLSFRSSLEEGLQGLLKIVVDAAKWFRHCCQTSNFERRC